MISEEISGMLDFFRVTASRVMSAASSVVVALRGDGDDTAAPEAVDGAELFGEAAVLFRPMPPDAAGAMEALSFRRGDEVVVIATKDRRWQVSLEDGEVVVRGFGAGAARVHLTSGGLAVIHADEIRIGSASASELAALASQVNTNLEQLRTNHNSHVHLGVTVGVGLTGIPQTPVAPLPTTECSKVRIE